MISISLSKINESSCKQFFSGMRRVAMHCSKHDQTIDLKPPFGLTVRICGHKLPVAHATPWTISTRAALYSKGLQITSRLRIKKRPELISLLAAWIRLVKSADLGACQKLWKVAHTRRFARRQLASCEIDDQLRVFSLIIHKSSEKGRWTRSGASRGPLLHSWRGPSLQTDFGGTRCDF